jgi:hypothetical protein
LGCSFQRNPVLTPDWEIGYFTKRKTGLFGALWIDDLRLLQGAGDGGRDCLKRKPVFYGTDIPVRDTL